MKPSAADGAPGAERIEAPQENEAIDYEQIDLGVRDVVRQLREAGFETTDSGDGVSKPAGWYDSGEALRQPHVFATCAPTAMLAEAKRMQATLGAGWRVEASYAPSDESAVLMAWGALPAPPGSPDTEPT